MTPDVVTIRVDASFKEVARLLDENSVSALPVLDEAGQLVGVVSEADLLPKEEYRGMRTKPHRFASPSRRHETAKAAGDVAGDVMTTPAVIIDPDATLAEAARRMVNEGVKRLPVVTSGGELVGIVSRADLVSAFLRPDEAIAAEVEQDLTNRVLLTERGDVQVQVSDGVVTLTGHLDRKSSVDIAEKLARVVDGVVDVKVEISHRWDDSKLTG
jgi:CBS domain-containing protein